MPNWIKLAGGWALAALIALAFSWGAVALVRNRVVQPAIAIPTTAPADAAAPADSTPTSIVPTSIHVDPEAGDAPTSATSDPGVATETTNVPVATQSQTSTTSGPTTAPSTSQPSTTSATSTTTSQVPGSTTTSTTSIPPGSSTTTSTTAPPEPQTTSYTLVGGVVTIRSSPGVVTFVSAIPQAGFSTDRRETGPDRVRIRFESPTHNSDFRAEWQGGELKITKNESVEN